MQASRRAFFRTAMSLGVATGAYPLLGGCATTDAEAQARNQIVPDPERLLDLPPGFTYSVHSRAGDVMDDGLLVPISHDGMACFPVEGDADRCVLVRNHELDWDEIGEGPYAAKSALPDMDKVYDIEPASGEPQPGGTTTLLFNLKDRRVERSHLSLSGTIRNCAGGMTPRGTWLSCEETLEQAGAHARADHGYVFEVDASAKGMVTPLPLKAMGRFNHEATATDPKTGIVYQTEDEDDSLIYRFLPDAPDELAKGGKLQILAIKGQKTANTRNWTNPTGFAIGGSWEVEWLDIDHIDNPANDMKMRGAAKGGAVFARGEGMCFALQPQGAAVFFACTSGGAAQYGQIWKYEPSAYEGTADEARAPGKLTLWYESPGEQEMDYCDNIVASPWGDLTVCEDGEGESYVRGVTPEGRVYSICRAGGGNDAEFAGACWSPDGGTLFVNLQGPHLTFAIRGPWARLARG
ncbi:MAG: phosphatase [Ponticaulis sp.]|nr:phosphatase [Ponticaulis sp.]|tara:strand:+ start:35178 stop:36572 length:1395 start_codon:yes stop_codon:yes gene_type:complete